MAANLELARAAYDLLVNKHPEGHCHINFLAALQTNAFPQICKFIRKTS